MSKISEMDIIVEQAIEMIKMGNGINETIDASVLTYDLTASETRAIIYFMAQRGYRYTNKGA